MTGGGDCTVLITGGTGQVGTELLRQPWPDSVTLLAPGRAELDLTSATSIAGWFAEHRVDCIINTAAFTAVDLAEDQAWEALMLNAQAPAWLAGQARERSIPLLHVSTDYVFDGSQEQPYREDDPAQPLGVYGASKLAGELAVRAIAPRHVILRTAWVVSPHRTNFLKTMLRLAGERAEVQVVADQIGSPTSARDLAAALRQVALTHLAQDGAPTGTYHFANAGSTSWHGLAEAVMAASRARGGPAALVTPIGTDAWPTRARRPANSRLDCVAIARDFGIAPRPWEPGIAEIVGELLAAEHARTAA